MFVDKSPPICSASLSLIQSHVSNKSESDIRTNHRFLTGGYIQWRANFRKHKA